MRRLFPSIQTKKKRSEKNSVTKDTADIGTPNTIITTTTPNSNFLSSRSKHPKNKKKKKKSRYTSLGDSSIDSSIDSVEELPSYNYEDSIRTTRTCMANIDATPIQRNDKTTAIMSSSPKMNTAAATTVGMTTSNHVYVLSDEYSWIPARIVQVSSSSSKSDSTKVTVSVPIYKDEQAIQSDGGYQAIRQEERIIDLSKYPKHIQQLPLQNVNENGILQSVQDMVDLPFLHEAAILYNLKDRHRNKKPYTRTGDIIIAVNPYQWLYHLYSENMRVQYASKLVWQGNNNKSNSDDADDTIIDARAGLEPHVYETSSLAYRGLAIEGEDQSILVSGESGAGKTETVKILLSDIASVQRGIHTTASSSGGDDFQSPIVQRVLDSNPLLEAFGNAKTIRNDNSSRFGKYIQLQFHMEDPIQAAVMGKSIPSCILAGSKCEVYLLEKSRVVTHTDDERTYHIFYQLLAADDTIKTKIWSELENTDNESFNYVGYTDTCTIEGQSDAQRFQKTIDSLELVGIKDDTFISLMRSICIVLQLGNLLFEADSTDESKSIVSSQQELSDLSDLMGVPVDILLPSLTIRTIYAARNEIFKVPLTAETAKESCDAFAKEIYAKAFLWLVRTINDATCAEKNYETAAMNNNKYGTIGLLDIFGFESFVVNRFEQLCINYANEKLQQKFTQDIFRSVQAEYEFEGIELGEITYDDNTDVLDLVEGRMGLLAFLNEECLRPGGSDTGFVSKAAAMNKENVCFIRQKGFRPYEFGIHHYAGIVVYDATAFVTKNMDTLPQDLQDCAKQSSNMILSKELTNESSMNAIISDHVATVVAHVAAAAANAGSAKKKPPPKRAPSKIPSPTASSKRVLGYKNNTSNSSNDNNASGNSALTKKNASGGSGLVGDTVWTKFKTQLSSLMMNLSKTRTRYIRCIKPNTMKLPLVMNHISTIEQLRCAGVVAAVTISRSAFPNRLGHSVVLYRFKALWRNSEHENEESLMDISTPYDERLKRLAGRMLSTALRKLETTKPDGAVVQGFVLGKTRTYFRSGALEYIENERVKCLNRWSIVLQRTARKYVARVKYVRRRTMTIRLQSMIRMLMTQQKYTHLRSSTIRIQCWYRCILAIRLIYTLRRNYKATLIQTRWRITRARAVLIQCRIAAILIQRIARGSLQRPKYRAALLERREEAKLENQVLALQRRLEEAEKRRMEAELRAIEDVKAAKLQASEDLKISSNVTNVTKTSHESEYHDVPVSTVIEKKRSDEKKDDRINKDRVEQDTEEMSALSEPTEEPSSPARLGIMTPPINLSLQQQALMDESGKMLEYLRKEVFKLRSQNQQLRSDFDLLKDNNQRLMDANASAGASFAALNQHAKILSKTNDKLNNELGSYKQQVQRLSITQVELREELKMKQATYVAEVHSRLQYQQALQTIVDVAQERCRDERLVEEFLRIADYHESGDGDDGSTRSMNNKGQSEKHPTTPKDSGLISSIRSFWS